VTEELLVPAMLVAALFIFWSAALAAWLLGRGRRARPEPPERT
jgi:hypothetical protein